MTKMASELPTHTAADKTTTSVNQSSNLSEAVFANPVDFLTTLKTVLPKANPADPDKVTQNDLIKYSKNGDNQKDREAAATAAVHYNDLRQLPTDFNLLYKNVLKDGLSAKEVGLDIDLAAGKLQGDESNLQSVNYRDAAVTGVVTAGATVAAIASVEFPPAAFVIGTVAVANSILAASEVSTALRTPEIAQNASRQTQAILAGWPEINGSSHPR
jgi:hypothetical protein